MQKVQREEETKGRRRADGVRQREREKERVRVSVCPFVSEFIIEYY